MTDGVIDVSAAVCVRNGKVFAAQRDGRGELAYHWEFPGGKLEHGETPELALVREIAEELHADIQVIRHISTVEHQYRTFTIRLHGFLCALLPGQDFTLSEHVNCGWFSPEELSTLVWSEADIPFANWVSAYLRRDR